MITNCCGHGFVALDVRYMRLRPSGTSVPQVLIVAGGVVSKAGGSMSGKEFPTAVAAKENAFDGAWMIVPVELSSSGKRAPIMVAWSSVGA